jgi:hypothetical protein
MTFAPGTIVTVASSARWGYAKDCATEYFPSDGNLTAEVLAGPDADGDYRIKWVSGERPHHTYAHSDFVTAADSPRTLTRADLAVGTRVRVVSNTGSPTHYFPIGTEGVVEESGLSSVCVRGDALTTNGVRTNFVNFADLALVETETAAETLDAFRLRFLVAAVARGERNGAMHAGQVKEALDEFARTEFLSPSKDLATFQRRVVDAAMSAKGKYGWCPEPENFLRDLGLGHLVKVKHPVSVTFTIDVEGEQTMTANAIREAAREQVRAQMGIPSLRVSASRA